MKDSRHRRQSGTSGLTSTSRILIQALSNAGCYPHPVSSIQVMETHASWVILTGEHAYKIKKPVNFGFLDYSTLPLRAQACREELRLNRSLAPELYLEVVPVTGSETAPRMNGVGQAIEYAVHMHEFQQQCQLDQLLASGALTREEVGALAAYIAAFHLGAPILDPAQAYGRPEEIHQPVTDNFSTVSTLLRGKFAAVITRLRTWSDSEYRLRRDCMEARHLLGFVRECHGDLHLANLVKYRGRILAFDRIEFSEALRWIDVMNDSAFLVMDFLFHGRPDLTFHFLNLYLQATGDYRGLAVLRYYLVYRALVRAKVTLLKANQTQALSAHEPLVCDAQGYLELACAVIRPEPVQIVLMHGFSGSGKTCLSERLMTALPAIRLRSDVERKRIAGLGVLDRSHSAAGEKLYTAASSERTYRELASLTESVCTAGYSVIIDAAFLQTRQRRMFRELAARLSIPWTMVECHAPQSVLRERVRQRGSGKSDASEADSRVLRHQLVNAEPLDDKEQAQTLCVETSDQVDMEALVRRLRSDTNSES